MRNITGIDDARFLALLLMGLERCENTNNYTRGVCRGLCIAVALIENKSIQKVIDEIKTEAVRAMEE